MYSCVDCSSPSLEGIEMSKQPMDVIVIDPSRVPVTFYDTDEEAEAAARATGKPIIDATKPAKLIIRKVGSNEKCPCGSGKKFKKCCGS